MMRRTGLTSTLKYDVLFEYPTTFRFATLQINMNQGLCSKALHLTRVARTPELTPEQAYSFKLL